MRGGGGGALTCAGWCMWLKAYSLRTAKGLDTTDRDCWSCDGDTGRPRGESGPIGGECEPTGGGVWGPTGGSSPGTRKGANVDWSAAAVGKPARHACSMTLSARLVVAALHT